MDETVQPAPAAREEGEYWRRFVAWRPSAPLLAVVAAVVILLLRGFDYITHPAFWAEDAIFWRDAYDGGFAWLKPQAGYLHFFPRLVAQITVLFPLEWHPSVMVRIGLAVMAWAAATLAYSKLPAAPAIAVLLVCIPIPEVMYTFTNLQWMTGAALLLLAFAPTPPSLAGKINRLVFMAFACLSGPFGIAAVPAVLVALYRDRNWFNAVATSLLILGAATQLWFIMTAGPETFPDPPNPGRLLSDIFHRTFGRLLTPHDQTSAWLPMIGAALWLATFAHPHMRVERLLAALGGMAIIVMTVWKFWNFPMGFAHPTNGDRYFFIPIFMIVASVAMLWSSNLRPAVIGAFGWFAGAYNWAHWEREALPIRQWQQYVPIIKSGEPVKVPVNPEGWMLNAND